MKNDTFEGAVGGDILYLKAETVREVSRVKAAKEWGPLAWCWFRLQEGTDKKQKLSGISIFSVYFL